MDRTLGAPGRPGQGDPATENKAFALRLGFSRISGFAEATAQRIVAARDAQAFRDVADLVHRAGLNAGERARLADGGAGVDGAVLARAEIVVLLMPLTAETRDLLNAERLALLPKGAVIINPGRGPLVDDEALLAALEAGRIGHATLDVFRTEPLPPEHPFWAHPRVTVTPHIAADTRAVTATRVIAENIRRAEAGEPMANLVDRGRGY